MIKHQKMNTSRNKIMPRNCYVFWWKNNQNSFKNDFKLFVFFEKVRFIWNI